MLSTLENVLKEKERELKLYQKFLNLKAFCEEDLFPFTAVPLQKHVERLIIFIEKLIPEPKGRTEEMFSGEIFVLLCALYFHDIGVVSRYRWGANEDLFNRIDISPKTLFLNYEIGKKLGIPESAIELINALIFSPLVKKVPVEWEIREDSKKAIIRNGRILEQILNFSHLIWDICSPDSGHISLRRFQDPDLLFRCGQASLAIDSREGVIFIKCRPEVPYQSHVLERVKEHVDGMFTSFKEQVNGRLGFQYKKIVWDVTGNGAAHDMASPPDLFPFTVYGKLPFSRWEEASVLLDKLFRYGHAVAVGEVGTGKTTMVTSFVVPQLKRISSNVFFCELWENPVNEIRQAVNRTGELFDSPDILSVFRRLLQKDRCFLILDCCERLKQVAGAEKEKFERFVEFCLDTEDMYLIVLGDKEEFFEWYGPFKKTSLSALFEINPINRLIATDDSPAGSGEELMPAGILKEVLDKIIEKMDDRDRFREVTAVLVDKDHRGLRRYTVADIFFDTCIPHEHVQRYMDGLIGGGIVKETHLFDAVYYALSSRHLKEPLYELLEMEAFEEKKRLRDALRKAAKAGELLPGEALAGIEKWLDRMLFSKEERGLVLAGLVAGDGDLGYVLQQAEGRLQDALVDPLIRLLDSGDKRVRERAVILLSRSRNEKACNSLLALLKKEENQTVRGLIVEGAISSRTRKAILAVMNILSDAGDREMRLRIPDLISVLPPKAARELLMELADVEKDPELLDRMDSVLARLEESA